MTALLLFLVEQTLDIFRRVLSWSSGPDDIIYLALPRSVLKCDYSLSNIYSSSSSRAENTHQVSAFHMEDLSQHLNNLWNDSDRYVRAYHYRVAKHC